MTRWSLPLLFCLGLTACGDPEIIVPDVMTIVALLPTHGSSGVNIDVQPLVYLSHTAANASDVEAAFGLECVGAAVGDACLEPSAAACSATQIDATVTYDSDAQVATLAPDALLQSDTCYELAVAAGIPATEENVGPLPVEVRSAFRTR